MDDFRNNNTSVPSGDDNRQPQQAEGQNVQPQEAAGAEQQPMEQQPAEQQPVQEDVPQAEEPRTPYQTPVQHPAYQPPRADAFDSTQQQMQEPQDGMQPPQPPKKKKGHGKAVVIGLCSVAAACLLFAGGAVIGHMVSGGDGGAVAASADAGDGELPTVQISSTPELDPDNYDVVNGLAGEEIYKKVSPSVVSVIATTASGTGSGSGVIMSTDGYIITNDHVVSGAEQVTVQLSDGSQLEAEIIGTDEQTDLAVIKITPD